MWLQQFNNKCKNIDIVCVRGGGISAFVLENKAMVLHVRELSTACCDYAVF